LGQNLALIASQEFARDAKEHGVYSLPAVVRRAGHPCQRGHLMPKMQPPASRVIITDTPEGLRVVISYSRSWFVSGCWGFWISGWAVAEVMVPAQFLKGNAPADGESLMYAWLAVWVVGGLLAIYAWLWQEVAVPDQVCCALGGGRRHSCTRSSICAMFRQEGAWQAHQAGWCMPVRSSESNSMLQQMELRQRKNGLNNYQSGANRNLQPYSRVWGIRGKSGTNASSSI
jgi:hypothetical protein